LRGYTRIRNKPLLEDKCVLLELKAGRALNPAHEAQLLNYLRATEIEVGMLFSFGLKPEFKRLAFDNSRKQLGEGPGLLETLLSTDEISHEGPVSILGAFTFSESLFSDSRSSAANNS
jgi:hypothetical protein